MEIDRGKHPQLRAICSHIWLWVSETVVLDLSRLLGIFGNSPVGDDVTTSALLHVDKRQSEYQMEIKCLR